VNENEIFMFSVELHLF